MMTLRRPAEALELAAVTLPSVNLLPPEITEAIRFRRVQAGLAAGVVTTLGLVGLLYVGANGAVGDAQRDVDAASAEQTTLRAETAGYADVTQTYARVAAAKQMLVQAMGSEVRYSRFLNDLSLSIPPDVWLTNATWSQGDATATAAVPTAATTTTTGTTATGATPLGTVTLTGVAKNHDDVAVWLEQLAAQKGYAEPYLQSSTEVLLAEKKVVNWSTTVQLTPDALSGRYTNGG